MTKQDYDRIIDATRELSERARKDKAFALALLQRAGIIDEQGQLAKPYAPSKEKNVNTPA